MTNIPRDILREMTHDRDLFTDPEVFRPERFLETTNPRLIDFTLPFGFGRRICPGLHVASQSIFIVVARSVVRSVFDHGT